MADYLFYSGPDTETFSATLQSSNTFTISSGTFLLNDAVYIPYSDVKGVYAICINTSSRLFQFDNEVYTDVPSNFSSNQSRHWDANADIIFNDVQTYRILTSVKRGLYSDAHKPYSSSVDYRLVVNNKRREYFRNTQYKSVKDLILSNELVFVDTCESVAYGVGFSGSDFEILNNKFKSSLEFNIATR